MAFFVVGLSRVAAGMNRCCLVLMLDRGHVALMDDGLRTITLPFSTPQTGFPRKDLVVGKAIVALEGECPQSDIFFRRQTAFQGQCGPRQ